jgi:hypothetical protein
MGAPKGNTNSLKHGLYARRFVPKDGYGVRSLASGDLQQEIHIMRIVVRNLFVLHARLREQVDEVPRCDPQEVDALSRLTNSLSLAVTSLSTIIRTHALLNAADDSMNDALEQALDAMPIFLDEKYLLEAGGDRELLRPVKVEEKNDEP